ncbi:hypothetical protein DL95DRAFT_452175 [Leptodontidium sp. 2 PMI_412]|nr:hypothetical protein DL95DRAFT_452175 [Leptodontidium sp. 2 PMI_412]
MNSFQCAIFIFLSQCLTIASPVPLKQAGTKPASFPHTKIQGKSSVPIYQTVEAQASPPGNPVTWQSAFWSLVPLALNSMTQPAGMVCFLPSTFGSILRNSPLICIIDTLILLEQLIWHTILLRSPLKAAKLTTEFRFQDVENNRPGGLSDLKTNTPFRIMLFLFGALPQLIKLFIMTGLPWTQVAGGAYIASFSIIELLNLLAWMGRPPLQQRRQQGHIPRGTTAPEEFIGLLSITHSILLAFYIFTRGFISACTLYLPKFHPWHTLLLLPLLVIYLSSIPIRPHHTNTNAQKALLYLILTTSFIPSLFLCISASTLSPILHAISRSLNPSTVVKFSQETAAVVAPILAALMSVLIVAFAGFKIVRDVLVLDRNGHARTVLVEMVSPWLYLVLHVVASVMVFAFAYDSEGTRKPLWAEPLG